jgi:hypothetical protein
MSEQLPLFESPKPPPKQKGGSLPRGPRGLLMALQKQGLSARRDRGCREVGRVARR